MKILAITLVMLTVACGGKAGTNSTPEPERDARLLDANDVALRPVLYAAAKHVFDPNSSQVIGFAGVYVNKRLEPSLSSDVGSYIRRIGGFRPSSRPADCEGTVERATPPRAPATGTGSRTGTGGGTGGRAGEPAPTQPTRTTGAEICNPDADAYYSFNSVRIASDTAYVEVQIAGTAKTSTKCLALTVNKEAGGWTPGEMKTSKIGKCGG